MSADTDAYDLQLKALTTEARNPESMSIDALTSIEIVELMNAEDATIADAVATQAHVIAEVIDVITDRLRQGGRLIYMGAGTSGRLGVLDATECPPTFNTRPEQVVGLIAGGRDALVRAVEGAEDYPEFGVHDLEAIHLGKADVVVGIATSGRTPYVVGGLAYARSQQAFAVGLTCNRDSALEEVADRMIVPVVGPEVISGSTRLKAGTATKLVLNMLTTGAMVRLGKTYGNLMVDLRATNQKLTDRSRRIVATITGVDDPEALSLLREAGGELKTAIVMQLAKVSVESARQQLQDCGGHLRTAVETLGARTSEPSTQVPRPSASPGAPSTGPGSRSGRSSSRQGSGSPERNYVLGVDGGGSKTVAWLAAAGPAEDVMPLGVGVSGPANPQAVRPVIGRYNIARAIAAAFDHAQINPHVVAAACLAIAGTGREAQRRQLEQWAQAHAFADQLVITTDADAVFDAVKRDGPLLVLIAGTGSICLGRDESGHRGRSGGWGYLIGDEGSGYAIGLGALRACARASDGRQPDAMPLRDAVLAELGLPTFESLIQRVYSQMATDREQLARIASIVLRTAEEGVAVSAKLLADAAEDLADLVAAVAGQFDKVPDDIALSGGLLSGSDHFRQAVQAAVGRRSLSFPNWHVVGDPVRGAVLRARALAECRPGGRQGPPVR